MSALWWIRIRGLCKIPDGRGWLWIKLGLALVGKAMLSKSLIQFSAMYGAVFPPCSLIWGQTIVAITMTSSKRTYARTPGLQGPLLSVPLTPWQATVNPCLCRRLPRTHRQVWLNVLWIHCSFLPSPAVHKVLFVVFQESLFPQNCGNSVIKFHWTSKSDTLEILSLFARSPGWEVCCGG